LFSFILAAGSLAMHLPASAGMAHAGLHESITGVSAQIERAPMDAGLYLQRGELYRQHQDWDAALADYETALRLAPGLSEAEFGRARMFFEAGWKRSAETLLSEFVRKHPEHARAHQKLAQLYARQNDHRREAEEYALAAQYSATVTPELYLAQARALAASGNEHLKAAIQVLDAGMERLGGCIPTLQNEAADMEIRLGRYDAALERLHKVQQQSTRKEHWLARRGAILVMAGHRAEARQVYRQALQAAGRVAPARRQTPMAGELEREIRTALARLDRPTARTRPAENKE